jgi:hypothetical protein
MLWYYVVNKTHWNIVAKEGLLYLFIVTCYEQRIVVLIHYRIYYYLTELQMGFYPVAVVLPEDTTQNNTHIKTHHAQTKHSTQSCTNNTGHITHNKYNTKKENCPFNWPGRPIGLWDVEDPILSSPVVPNLWCAYPRGTRRAIWGTRK